MWVVSYDTPSDRRRRRIVKVLEGYGRRVQYSVFECDITADQREKLTKLLQRIVQPEEDDVRFYPLDEDAVQRVILLGRAELQRSHGHYLI
jgi:CRISPR-associated protein Cas2